MTEDSKVSGRAWLEKVKADATEDRAPLNECTNGMACVVGGVEWAPQKYIRKFVERISDDDSLLDGPPSERTQMYLGDAAANLSQLLAELDCWKERASRLCAALEEALARLSCCAECDQNEPTSPVAIILSKLSEPTK